MSDAPVFLSLERSIKVAHTALQALLLVTAWQHCGKLFAQQLLQQLVIVLQLWLSFAKRKAQRAAQELYHVLTEQQQLLFE